MPKINSVPALAGLIVAGAIAIMVGVGLTFKGSIHF